MDVGCGAILNFGSNTRRTRETRMSKLMKKIRDNKSGATAIEYALIASLIAVVIITAAGALGNKVSAKFNQVTTAMN